MENCLIPGASSAPNFAIVEAELPLDVALLLEASGAPYLLHMNLTSPAHRQAERDPFRLYHSLQMAAGSRVGNVQPKSRVSSKLALNK